MDPRSRVRQTVRAAKDQSDALLDGDGIPGKSLGETFLANPEAIREQAMFLFVLLYGMQLLGRALSAPFRALDALIQGLGLDTRASDRAQTAAFGVIGLLIVLLVAGIVLILGPTILALLTTSLPSTANTSWNSTYNSVQGNVDTAFVIGGVLLVIVVIGAMITVLLTSFTGGMRGGGGGGLM